MKTLCDRLGGDEHKKALARETRARVESRYPLQGVEDNRSIAGAGDLP